MALARRQPWSASRAYVPDRGQVRVLGLDPRQDRAELHERLGVQLQQGALPPQLKVGEAVELYASFYERPADAAVLLQRLRLDATRGSYWRALSCGQEQRLSIVLALIASPRPPSWTSSRPGSIPNRAGRRRA